ncbi:hypothetical protein BDZ89DRAFT_1046889 [Hymenopellis radicata]|nr:hypothetical protein BDZ89DRAFT_1046889 [Hymenopellis radicata]
MSNHLSNIRKGLYAFKHPKSDVIKISNLSLQKACIKRGIYIRHQTDSCVVELYPVADDNVALVLAGHILVCQWSERCDIKAAKHVPEPPGDGRCSRGKREAHSRCKRCGDNREQSGNDLVRGRVRQALWHVPRSCGAVVWNESGGNEGAAGLFTENSKHASLWPNAQQMGEKHWHKTYLRSNSFFLLPGPACLAYHSNAVKIPNHSGISNDLRDFIRAFEDSKKNPCLAWTVQERLSSLVEVPCTIARCIVVGVQSEAEVRGLEWE